MVAFVTIKRDAMPADFDLETFLPYRMNRASEAISRDFAQAYKRLYGMTRPEWRVLAALGQLGRLTATQIGRHSAMHKTQVSRAVQRLEDRRWLTRATDDADRRLEHLDLTRAGRAAYAELSAHALRYQEQLARELGSDAFAALQNGLTSVEREKKLTGNPR